MTLSSTNPATGETVWQGPAATPQAIEQAILAAEEAAPLWRRTSFEKRAEIARSFAALLDEELAAMISQEMGKPLWESRAEVEAMRKKVELSISAYHMRCPVSDTLQHKPHGLGAVFGPFNFPGHLPNGHIVPLLLAGNCLLFKPSELTPGTGALMQRLWQEAGLPSHVLTTLQGDASIGQMLLKDPRIRGIYFTGSNRVGQLIAKESLAFPNRIVALEMGGNNPLIISHSANIEAQVYHTIQSSYITSGQRCSCARRLIVIQNESTKEFIDLLIKRAKELIIAPYTLIPEPYMGPVVNAKAANAIMQQYNSLITLGAKVLMPMKQLEEAGPYLSPGLIDCTDIQVPDEEIFGPLLQLTYVKDLSEAILKANETQYGLTAGLLSDNPHEFERVLDEVNAGIINWNAPTTGASSAQPFGGVGKSGNFRPSGYWSADYASYPVATTKHQKLMLPEHYPQGYPHAL